MTMPDKIKNFDRMVKVANQYRVDIKDCAFDTLSNLKGKVVRNDIPKVGYKPLPQFDNGFRPNPTLPSPMKLTESSNDKIIRRLKSLEKKMDKILSILNENVLNKEIKLLSAQHALMR